MSEEYEALIREQQEAHDEYRKGEGKRITRLTALKANYEERRVIEVFVEELPFLGQLAIVDNGGNPDDYDEHQIVIEAIGRNMRSVIYDTKLPAKEFIELYMKTHNLDVCPSPADNVGIHSSVSSAIAEINVGRDASMTDDSVDVEITVEEKENQKKYAQTISYWVQGLIWVPLNVLLRTRDANEKSAKFKALTAKKKRDDCSKSMEYSDDKRQ